MPLHQALFRGAIFLMRVLLSWAADNDDDNDDDGDDDDDDDDGNNDDVASFIASSISSVGILSMVRTIVATT